ncbi:hypothetical protein AAC387_Pa07g1929 [Persea americana]
MAKGELEMAELESALAKQEAELKEKFLAEHDTAMGEEESPQVPSLGLGTPRHYFAPPSRSIFSSSTGCER